MASLVEQRGALVSQLEKYQTRLKSGEVSDEDVQKVKQLLTDLETLDTQIDKANESAKLVAAIGALGPSNPVPAGQAPDEGKGAFATTGQPKQYLDLRGLSQSLPHEALKYSARLMTKGLAPNGESLIPVPIVNRDPIAGDIDAETPPHLAEVIPAVSRRASTGSGETTAASYDILVENSVPGEGGASVVAPGDEKPIKKLAISKRHQELKVIAVLSDPIDRYLLEDATNLQAWIGNRLSQEVRDALDAEIIGGDGTGQHMTGLAHTEGVQTQSFSTNVFDTIAAGISKLESASIAVDFIAMSPADWLSIQTYKDAQGRYYMGDVLDATNRKVYGCRIVSVPGISAGTGWIVGKETLTLSTDSGLKLEWDRSSGFSRNQIQARVEGRFNLDVLKPHGLVKVELTEPTGK